MSEVEEIVEAAPAEGETSSESAAEAQQETQEGEVKPKGGFQKRIDRLTKSNSQLEQEKEYWRTEALKPKPVETPKAASASDSEPSENDFQTHAEYVRALARHEAQKVAKSIQSESRTEAVKTQQQKAQQDFKERQEAFRAATPDFDDVVEDADIQVSHAVITEIVESERGPELQYYLAKNPDEAKRLSGLAPLALAREVGKIEARLTTSQPVKTAKTTSAPPPPNVTGKSTPTSTKDPGEMTPAQYREWRAKQ